MTGKISQMNAGIEGTREEIGRLNDNIEEVKGGVRKAKDRVVRHFRENRKTYIGIVASGLVCGVAGASMRGGPPGARITEFANMINGPSWRPTQTQINQFVIPALGDPGDVVQVVETGEIFASKGAYARARGVPMARVSQHTNGHRDQVNSEHLRVLGKAGHPIAV